MAQQLPLIQTDRPRRVSWKLDEQTRETGLRGVQESRQALREAAQRRLERLAQDHRAA